MSNQINELSPDFRDFLLKRNLIVADTISNNGLSNLAVGLGQRAQISDIATSIQASEDLEVSSERYRDFLVSRNCYTSIEDMVQATIIDNSFCYNQRDGGYIQNNGELNLGGPSTDALDVITSITSQEGFSLGDGGFIPNNTINTSITGRVLGGTGVIEDTPLGIIGAQQLLLALKQKIAFNTQKEIFGMVNLQPFSLLSGSDFIVPDYSITVSSSSGGRVLDTVLDLSGFELPLSKMDAGASIFEDTALFQPDSVQRNNAMIMNTGKGQILRLFESLNKNQFKPAYESERDDDRLGIIGPEEYGSFTGETAAINLINNEVVEFVGDDLWFEATLVADDKNSLIYKTKTLFENNDINLYKLMFGLDGHQDLSRSNQLTTPNGKNGSAERWLSKGSGVLSESFLTGEGDGNVFCRTWNSRVSYDNVSALQKNSGLKDYPNQYRRNLSRSVLDDNGFVKVSPYKLPEEIGTDADYAKKFMFSIENLAWNDRVNDLPHFETGPGDPISRTKGRIMWFPPYDIKFDESTAVNWDKTDFIGRGEPVFTYNNTVRSGNLSFKIIIDHPNYVNDINSLTSDQIIASIAAGCSEYETFFSPTEIDQIREVNSAVPAGRETVANNVEAPDDINFYFPNDVATLSSVYEITGEVYGDIPSEGYNATEGTLYDNGANQGLNDFWNTPANIEEIKTLIDENSGFSIFLNAYASTAGNNVANKALSDARLASVKAWVRSNFGTSVTVFTTSNGSTQSSSDPSAGASASDARKERKVTLEFLYEPSLDDEFIEPLELPVEPRQQDRELVAEVRRRFHKESDYFEKLGSSEDGTDKFIYESIREKIKFFQPAFHSTTPEGFNSRLTFLQQCTRQGPTIAEKKANNLAFGSPPVCILRIGDFYNTKIIIENLSFKFEPLVWDLNPEGVGVQPMIANVSMSFKFIGGSSLTGPINRLQNAVSFNYFANTEVYDPRADIIVPVEDGFEISGGTKDLRAILDEKDYEGKTDKSANEPMEQEQEEVAEEANSGPAPEPSTGTTNDRQIIELIGWTVTFNSFISSGTTNTFDLSYQSGIGYNITNLSKPYGYKIELKTTTGAYQMVMTGTFKPYDAEVINSSESNPGRTWNQGEYGTGYQTFRLSITSGGISYSEVIKVDVETGLIAP